MVQNHFGIHQRRFRSFLIAIVFTPFHSLDTGRALLQAKKPFYSKALMLDSLTSACPLVESLVTSVGLLLLSGLF